MAFILTDKGNAGCLNLVFDVKSTRAVAACAGNSISDRLKQSMRLVLFIAEFGHPPCSGAVKDNLYVIAGFLKLLRRAERIDDTPEITMCFCIGEDNNCNLLHMYTPFATFPIQLIKSGHINDDALRGASLTRIFHIYGDAIRISKP